jgi:hypothetical protein
MQHFRLATDNAIELYLRDPSFARAEDIVETLAHWPFMERTRHAGIFLAVFDVLQEKHGHHGNLRNTWGVRVGKWCIRKSCPESRPTWTDYFILTWLLTKDDRPGLARIAIRQLDRRGWHLPLSVGIGSDTNPVEPEWEFCAISARDRIMRECREHPGFRAAMLAEIKASPCKRHEDLEDFTGCAA